MAAGSGRGRVVYRRNGHGASPFQVAGKDAPPDQ
jgi:hypothetical protein